MSRPHHPLAVPDRIALFLATLGPVGRFPRAPGTAGSAVALLAAPFLFLPLGPWGRLAILAALFAAGFWAATRAERILGRPDPGCVVIDEVLGQWMALLPLSSPDPWAILAGFALFRILDMTKPPPIRQSESWLPRGGGIMLDDALAGGLTALILWAFL
ncbi:phosphatidylglycerophosphatase A family protein [Desulfolutivibrio sulfoxidireducens]|uniref:phosphatidylglycerophosphatase A family protein n=1 Tax=Desulfolutivibrio sulfoxidireducens TaxID=2773299 RepID=UPI00159E85D2|nr:phosphatidylglycerophosphatase A [Desulfolutivibrio sulfoxidireducens]QLA17005.1 phosphatidylglycerophosphatase A [Desulfolutivibrio sulfoxidireducens]QLA20572.1 phosphatidylglycerophosphatase A [Desulfolutivibrio sulfoxidireducens]